MPWAPRWSSPHPARFEPLTSLIDGGPFNPQPGQWTDDTSMALCLADGQITSALYGAEAIPSDWRKLIAMRSRIEELASQLCQRAIT